MTRSKQKSPQINLLHKTKIISRYSEILPNFIGQAFKVHCGNKYTEILVKENMVGHKFGEFSFTRKKFIWKKKLKNGPKN